MLHIFLEAVFLHCHAPEHQLIGQISVMVLEVDPGGGLMETVIELGQVFVETKGHGFRHSEPSPQGGKFDPKCID